jgi:hypothetical protein
MRRYLLFFAVGFVLLEGEEDFHGEEGDFPEGVVAPSSGEVRVVLSPYLKSLSLHQA